MEPEQLLLFDFSTIDLRRLRESRERIMKAETAVCTRRAYASGWKAFRQWCELAGRESLPASTDCIADFVCWCIEQKLRLETAAVRVNAINWYHRGAGFAPPGDESIRALLANARRLLKERPAGKTPISYELLSECVAALPAKQAGLRVRNRAMILLAFAAGWRRSEVVKLDDTDVKFVPKGMEVFLPNSKTDQIGEGLTVGIPPGTRVETCPVRAMRAWIAYRGDWRGPLFVGFRGKTMTHKRMHERAEMLHRSLKRALVAAGIDAKEYGSHSLRAGMITTALEHGASEAAIMKRTGQKSVQTVHRYFRPASAFSVDPLASVL
jgi:integrase